MNPWPSADRGPRGEPEGQRDDPGVRLVEAEAERLGDPLGLDHGHEHAGEAEGRPDRQVDVARHDDEDHARRHDRDGRALDRQVPQVAGREEQARRDEVEDRPRSREWRRSGRARRVSISSAWNVAIGDRRGGSCVDGGRGPVRPRSSRRLASRLEWNAPCPAAEPRGRAPCLRRASAAGGDGPGRNVLAQGVLGDPPGVDDGLEVVLQDRAAA